MTSTAVAAASWGRARWRQGLGLAALPGPLMSPAGNDPDGGTGDTIGLKVEIYLGGQGWIDISPYVYYRDRIHITRGKPDETSQVQPQTATLTINNRDGRFSPRNPLGPYYGTISRNTPIRISRLNNGIRRYRFTGEVPAWPSTWDISGTDVYVQVQAAGPLRRLNQGSATLRSPLFRYYALSSSFAFLGQFLESVPYIAPAAYWPCEDGQNSTQIASGIVGNSAMTLSGQSPPTFASNTSLPGSDALPVLNASIWTGTVPTHTLGDSNILNFVMAVPSTGDFDTGVIASMYTAGTVARVDLQWGAASSGSLQLSGYSSGGSQLFTTGYLSITGGFAGQTTLISMYLSTNGSSVNYGVGYETFSASSSGFGQLNLLNGGTTAGAASIGLGTKVAINPLGQLSNTAIGHIAYLPAAASPGLSPPDFGANDVSAFFAWNGDTPHVRFSRLCSEQNVNGVFDQGISHDQLVALQGEQVEMGYQKIDTFPNLIQQCSDTATDPLFEARDQVALVYRSHLSLYNQAPTLTLDYSQHQLSAALDPVDDDALTRNDVTVTRIDGSSIQQRQLTGSLNTQPFPAGVGDYATSYDLSIAADSQLGDHAGWRLHLGTVDEPRYPRVQLNLRHSTFTSSVSVMNAALTIDIGDRYVISNPPPWMPPDQISQILLGYSETLGIYEHDMVLTGAPESPYEIAMLEDAVLGRADTDGSTLGGALGPTDTAIPLVTTGASSPAWTTNHQDTPFDVGIGGERVTLAVAGTLLNQNPFFATNINGWSALGVGATASWSTDYLAPGATGSLKVAPPGGVATIDAHDALTGVGTVTPSRTYVVMAWVYSPNGWSDLRVCVDWYDASGVFVSSSLGSPSVVPAGAWTFLTQTLTAPAVSSQAQLRVRQGSSPASTDVFYCWAVRMVPSASVSTSSPQTFTGIRSVNGVVKAQTAGADVRLWQPMILSL